MLSASSASLAGSGGCCDGGVAAVRASPGPTSSARPASQLSSRRELRDRSMSRLIRPTTVVSQPPRLVISVASLRLSRSHASCTASSASAADPSTR